MRNNIPSKMNAVVTHGPFDYRFEQVDIPRAGMGEALLRIEGCGICAGDIKAYLGGEVFWGNGISPPYLETPVIGGHEIIGTVAEISDDACIRRGLTQGDRVAVEQIVPCGKCRYCLNGQYSLCIRHDVFGFKHYLNGGFAEYALMPDMARIYKIPADMPLTDALLIEPYACAYHAIERAMVTHDDILVISGCGTLGLGMVSAAKLKKPAKIIALDLVDERLALAAGFGADIIINPSKTDAIDKILSLTDGYGCDIYVEATGHSASVIQGLEAIRKNGRFIEFSLFNDTVTCNWSIIGDGKELDIYGVSLSPNCFPPVIERIADGRLKTKGIVTHRFKLEDFAEAFSMCRDSHSSVKVILES